MREREKERERERAETHTSFNPSTYFLQLEFLGTFLRSITHSSDSMVRLGNVFNIKRGFIISPVSIFFSSFALLFSWTVFTFRAFELPTSSEAFGSYVWQ